MFSKIYIRLSELKKICIWNLLTIARLAFKNLIIIYPRPFIYNHINSGYYESLVLGNFNPNHIHSGSATVENTQKKILIKITCNSNVHTICWALFKGFISIYKTNKNSSSVLIMLSHRLWRAWQGVWEGEEKAFSPDAATDPARLTGSQPVTQPCNSPQLLLSRETPQMTKEEKTLWGHKTDCWVFLFPGWSIPQGIEKKITINPQGVGV